MGPLNLGLTFLDRCLLLQFKYFHMKTYLKSEINEKIHILLEWYVCIIFLFIYYFFKRFINILFSYFR